MDFDAGVDIAVSDAPGRALEGDGADGTVLVRSADPAAPGFLATGRLHHVGEHYLRDADGKRWIKGGVDSPENFLGYAGFDGTVDRPGGAPTPGLVDGLHRYGPHVADWREGDPLFASEDTGIDSRGIVGAVNYLAAQGVNSIYFLPMNLGGDGRETYPFVGASGSVFDDTHYDVSKLFQWNLVLAHMQERGIAAHVVLSEQEHGNMHWLDDGELGVERKLYHRELVARFSYLNGLKWNIGEESHYGAARETAFARHLKGLDRADHPVAVHTHADAPEATYVPLLGLPEFDASSIQFGTAHADAFVETWRARSAEAGRKWVIDMDEVGSGGVGLTDRNLDAMRREVLYPVCFSGGNLEWHFGHHALPLGGDMQTEDFRTREPMYRWMRIAREFMDTYLPLDRTMPDDGALTGGDDGDQVFSAPGEVHALYLPIGRGTRELRVDRVPGEAGPDAVADMPASAATGAMPDDGSGWDIAWFDPRAGRFEGGRRAATGPVIALGEPPSAPDEDWVVLVRRMEATAAVAPLPVPASAMPPNPMAPPAPSVPELGAAAPAATPVGPATALPAPPASRPDLSASAVTTAEPTAGTGGGAAWALLALVLSGRLIRSRMDGVRLV